MKDNPMKTIHLPYKLFSQSRFSEGGSGATEQDKGLSELGAKILSEKKKKKKSRRGKNFLSFLWVELVRLFINWLFFKPVLACFLR